MGYFKIVDREQGIGNRELVPCSLFWVCNTNISKVQIENKEPVRGSFLTIIGFILVSGWLVGCFEFNGPLRQYFSLYQAVSQREGERGEKG